MDKTLRDGIREILHSAGPVSDRIACDLEKFFDEYISMRLAAISTACLQNTEKTIQDRIDSANCYWTVAYNDVCRAIDREMEWRSKFKTLAYRIRREVDQADP